ncbi:unnamed protein product [Alopecurus aequalis]
MESPPFKIGQDEDRVSALPDHLLLGILERLGLREEVRAGMVSTRWRHLPHQLSRLNIYAKDFHSAARPAPHEIMEVYTATMLRLLSAKCECDCKSSRAVKTIVLHFYLSAPHLSSIGHAVEDVVSLGKTRKLGFWIRPPSSHPSHAELAEFGRQFISFSRMYPVAFRWLTELTLEKLAFGDSGVADLISACNSLKCLTLRSCRLVEHSTLKIDTPCSCLTNLTLIKFYCTQIELISLPKLRTVACKSRSSENPPVRFGYVPELSIVHLSFQAKAGQAPFALSKWLPRSAGNNLSKLYLNFVCQMIWIQPEHPKQLTPIFRNLTDMWLARIFPECDLNWTLFILEAAPSLQHFKVYRIRHSCVKRSMDSAEKTNVVWEPSKDFKHLNLKLLVMEGFEDEDKVTNYIRLVMERAVVLKRIELHGNTCNSCNDSTLESPGRFQVDEASRHRVKERLTHESSSSVEIIII